MKKSLLLLTALVSMFYYSEDARAGFLLEPYFGMNMNSTGELGTTDVDITGNSIGARVGFQNLGFMFGVDGRRSSWNLEFDNADIDATVTTLGAFVGYDFPILLRVWGEYVISHNGIDENDTEYTEGSGTIIGLGYKVMPFVSLNLEIGNFETAKAKTDGGSEGDLDAKYNTFLLGVSIPISL